jgi:uncharacterized protein (UPF0335 family)
MLGFTLAPLKWMMRGYIERFEALEKVAVTDEDLKETFAQWRSDRQTMHEENLKHLSRIEGKIDIIPNIGVVISRIERAEKDIDDLREWKHEKADPYIRAMDVIKERVDNLAKRT